MTIRFGASPIAWINDDMPELGGDTPLESVLADCQAIGFSGVELGGVLPRDPAVLKPLLDRYGLSLVGGWYSGNLLAHSADDEIAALQSHLNLLKAMDCLGLHPRRDQQRHPWRPLQDLCRPRRAWTPKAGRNSARGATEVADYIARQGLKFAYHHHLGTIVERPEDLEAFLANTGPSVGLTVDTGHAALGGLDPVQVIRGYPHRVAHVHCKDIRSEVFHKVVSRGGGGFLDGVLAGMFTVPGDGHPDYAAVMQALAEIGYSGWIIVEAEQDPAIANPRHYGEIGLATLKREALAAGLKAA
ncbi:myo-inosose-2 dehydratase [Caulobacter segnis]